MQNIDATVKGSPVVLWDKVSARRGQPSLLYVYRDASGSPGKAVFRVDYTHNGQSTVTPVNIQTAADGKANSFLKSMQNKGTYELVRGSWKSVE